MESDHEVYEPLPTVLLLKGASVSNWKMPHEIRQPLMLDFY